MKYVRWLLLSVSLTLGGCGGKSAAWLKDLGGLVFLIFCGLLVFQTFLLPWVTQQPKWKQWIMRQKGTGLTLGLVSIILGVTMIGYGFGLNHGSSSVSPLWGFVGTILSVAGIYVRKYFGNEDTLEQQKCVKVLSLCISFGAALVFLIYAGTNM